MSRLIDADKLMAELKEYYDDCDIEDMLEFVGISNFINRQPTAFDVDKVVEELEERADIISIPHNFSVDKKVVISLNDALDIVKRGGIGGAN